MLSRLASTTSSYTTMNDDNGLHLVQSRHNERKRTSVSRGNRQRIKYSIPMIAHPSPNMMNTMMKYDI